MTELSKRLDNLIRMSAGRCPYICIVKDDAEAATARRYLASKKVTLVTVKTQAEIGPWHSDRQPSRKPPLPPKPKLGRPV